MSTSNVYIPPKQLPPKKKSTSLPHLNVEGCCDSAPVSRHDISDPPRFTAIGNLQKKYTYLGIPIIYLVRPKGKENALQV